MSIVSTVRAVDLMIDVTGSALEGVELSTAITVFLPEDLTNEPRVVAFGFPGGGYGRRYWDIHHPGVEGYSEAEEHVRRGWIFVACDHLGVGDSSAPDPALLTYEVLAAANDTTVRAIVEGLRAGTLVDGVGPVPVAGVVGMGQSIGGCLSIVAQGRHRTFDALAVLGFSARQTILPSPAGYQGVSVAARNDTDVDLDEASLLVADFGWAFHWEDVPAVLREADMGEGYPLRLGKVPAWGSASIPPVAASMLTPGVVSEEAALIDVPVFVGAGERDVLPDPRGEPTAYRSSPDITVVVVPTMAHMHNFASTRQHLWDRLHAWAEAVIL
jgi:pimeloyl-ACP methyl ester carboxylesterase